MSEPTNNADEFAALLQDTSVTMNDIYNSWHSLNDNEKNDAAALDLNNKSTKRIEEIASANPNAITMWIAVLKQAQDQIRWDRVMMSIPSNLADEIVRSSAAEDNSELTANTPTPTQADQQQGEINLQQKLDEQTSPNNYQAFPPIFIERIRNASTNEDHQALQQTWTEVTPELQQYYLQYYNEIAAWHGAANSQEVGAEKRNLGEQARTPGPMDDIRRQTPGTRGEF